MGTILGASYYQLKYCLRNKLRQATGDPDFLYRHYVGKPFYDTDAFKHIHGRTHQVRQTIYDGPLWCR